MYFLIYVALDKRGASAFPDISYPTCATSGTGEISFADLYWGGASNQTALALLFFIFFLCSRKQVFEQAKNKKHHFVVKRCWLGGAGEIRTLVQTRN